MRNERLVAGDIKWRDLVFPSNQGKTERLAIPSDKAWYDKIRTHIIQHALHVYYNPKCFSCLAIWLQLFTYVRTENIWCNFLNYYTIAFFFCNVQFLSLFSEAAAAEKNESVKEALHNNAAVVVHDGIALKRWNNAILVNLWFPIEKLQYIDLKIKCSHAL